MRNLTIKRRKVTVGSLAKARIYIEDPLSQEITINKVPCRKLGELKNGEEQTFPIGNEAVRIFAISDKLSKEYSNEHYQIPEGEDDLVLAGQFQMSPGGTAFQFDDNNSIGVAAKRKKGAAIGLIVLILACLLGFFGGKYITGGFIKSHDAAAKDFTSHGMNITLTKSFAEDSMMGQTACFSSKDVLVVALREPFTLVDGLENATVEEYGELSLDANGMSASQLKSFDGIPGYEYDSTDEESGDTFHTRAYLYKADDAFWMVQFITFKDNFAKYEPQIGQWAKSVTFGS